MFESYRDSAMNSIHNEGQEITLSFQKTGPTTARVSWNIPTSVADCSEDGRNAYNGIVVTVLNQPSSLSNSPIHGTYYQGDPTTNKTLHSGDVINGALVVGAFYDDITTMFVDITDLQANVPYFVSAYAVDNVARYHIEGVHAYSLEYGNTETADTSAYQIITLGVTPTDNTSLDALETYTLKINIDSECYDISIPGSAVQTYQELVDFIQEKISLFTTSTQSSGYPNIGYLYLDPTGDLFLWNGENYESKILITHPIDPTIVVANDHWLQSLTNVMSIRSGVNWNAVTPISYHQDPTQLECDDYWFDGVTAYNWNGSVWVPLTTYNQLIDPSATPILTCPLYWYDDANQYFYVWSEETSSWNISDVVIQSTDPSILNINDFWFSLSTSLLFQWDGAVWQPYNVTVSNIEPTTPINNDAWFDTLTEVLNIYNSSTTSWDITPSIIWNVDPSNISAGDVWWNNTLDDVFVWDILTSNWVLTTFILSEIDPSLPLVLNVLDAWFQSNELRIWDGDSWNVVTVIIHPTNPTIISIGNYWYNPSTLEWNIWTGVWSTFPYITYVTDPTAPFLSDYWYDGTTLYTWSGLVWTTVLFSTIDITPQTGFIYYDTSIPALLQWKQSSWNVYPPIATFEFNSDNNIVITSTTVGSTSKVFIDQNITSLLNSLIPVGVASTKYSIGTDGLESVPAYSQFGVGNDGTPDERRELIDSMRAQLGYPVIEVELTKYQWDQCVNGAIESLRKRSSVAYKREYFFMDMVPGRQIYQLTDKNVGFNSIIDVTDIYRMSSSFITGVGGQNPHDQIILQQLYSSSTFDLVSYHLMQQYIKLLSHMTAHDLLFQWDEDTRNLFITRRVYSRERILLDCVTERTEQNLFKDRFLKTWIEKFSLAQARITLAEIRGKYTSIAGPNGSTILNSADLRQQAAVDIADCMDQLDRYIAEKPEEWGMSSTFLIG